MPNASTGLFTSAREQRLWTWALVVVVGIYVTIGLVSPFARYLRAQGLLEMIFVVALFLAVVAIVVIGLSTKPGPTEIGIAIGTASAYIMVLSRITILEERSHLFEYGVLAALTYLALAERRSQGRRVPVPALLAIVITTAVGWIDEGIQLLLPSRVYDIWDVGFNALAAFMAVLAIVSLSWARRRRRKRSS